MMAAAQQPVPAPILKLRERVEEINRRRASEPQVAAPAPLALSYPAFYVRGKVLGEARVYTEAHTGVALLSLMVAQPEGGLPVLAVRRYDATPSAHVVAWRAARRLRGGCEVRVQGHGWRLADHKGEPVLEVVGVCAVYETQPPTTTRKDIDE